MSGVAGRSGRKSHLEDKTAKEIIELSAKNIMQALADDSTLKPLEKAELSKHFVLKAMPSVIESDGSFAPKMVMLVRNDRAVREERNAASL